MSSKLKVEFIEPNETLSLRHRVLKPQQKIEDVEYPGDHTSTSFHLGIRNSGTIVCVGSLFLENLTDFKDENQYRLRGMATEADLRGKGYGKALLEEAERIIRQRGATLIWCYAREKAIDFYKSCGLECHGSFFDVPGVARHKVMFKNLI
jgi:GNAT superfamily N-acetyltransferase